MTVFSIFRNLLRLRKLPQYIERLFFKPFILVFQMGKVGSRSIIYSIQISLRKQNGKSYKNTMLFYRHRRFLIDDLPDKLTKPIISWRVRLGLPIKIICPIREPIARNVSAFFYFYCKVHLGSFPTTDLKELEELFLKDSREKSADPFLAISYLMSEHEFPLNWFDEHFKPLTRIDVYKQPFPIDRKWKIYRRGFTQVLLYRVDLKRSEQTKLVSRFLGLQVDEIRSKNAAKEKDYAELYSRFRESVKLPEQYIRRMHDSRFAKHFWSPAELKAAADKWRGAPDS